jgi:transposase
VIGDKEVVMDGPPRKYGVELAPCTRERLEEIVRNGSAPAKKITHARVLLMADEHHPAGRYHDRQIAQILGLHINTIAKIRKDFVLGGEQPALERRKRAVGPVQPKLDGHGEAQLVALCCGKPPAGRVCWTLSLLQEELIGRKIVTSISCETVRKTLKKTCCSRGGNSVFAFPSEMVPASSRRWNRCLTSTRSRRITRSR